MNVFVPQSLENATSVEDTIDAVYFVVRVLRNCLRGYRHPTVSSEPAPAARQLARRAIEEIEAAERNEISNIDEKRVSAYITKLEEFLSERAAANSPIAQSSGDTILEQMRAQGV